MNISVYAIGKCGPERPRQFCFVDASGQKGEYPGNVNVSLYYYIGLWVGCLDRCPPLVVVM